MSSQATFEPVSAKTQPVSGHTACQIPDIENSSQRAGATTFRAIADVLNAPWHPHGAAASGMLRMGGKDSNLGIPKVYLFELSNEFAAL